MSSAADYDNFPYESHAFTNSQPTCLSAIARMFGMRPPGLEDARVLELGCSSGGNLLPLAEQFPAMTLVGVDFSERQINDGKQLLTSLGYPNVSLRHMDIMDIDASFGSFDYIVCHGVFSWVPPQTQEKILSICKELLSEHGVAYVSYNTNPGWHMRGMIRDMMLYHTAGHEDAAQKVQQARALLDFMAANVRQGPESAYRTLLENEVKALSGVGDYYLRHDHLSEHNSALYFHQFMERAHAHDLQYLADAELVGMLASNLPKETHQTLLQVAPDILRMEQYMDFLRNRTFRMTLLAHAAQPINRNLSGEQLSGLHLSAALSGQERTPDGGVSFRSLSGAVLTSSSPDFIRALAKLVEASPRTMSVDELVIAVPLDSQVLNAGTQRRETLALDLMQCVFGGFVRLHGHPISCTGIVSDRPRASRLAREQARLSSMATSQRHQTQPLNDLSRQVVQRLDGTKTHDDLIQDLISLTHAGELAVADSGTPIEEPRALREALVLALNTTLEQLAEQALLIS